MIKFIQMNLAKAKFALSENHTALEPHLAYYNNLNLLTYEPKLSETISFRQKIYMLIITNVLVYFPLHSIKFLLSFNYCQSLYKYHP